MSTSKSPHEIKTRFYRTIEFPSLIDCLYDFLEEFRGSELYPHNATLAVAGAPYEKRVTLPNTTWPTLDEDELSHEFNIYPFSLINDFVAIGYSMVKLGEEDLIVVHDTKRSETSTKIVAGPGTGMGECILQAVQSYNGTFSYNVFGTEGGHKNFAPTSKLEWEYLNFVLEEYPEIKENIGYLSTEKAFCGPGIPIIYKFFCKKDGIKTQEFTSEEIIQKGLAKDDKQCHKTLELFVTLYAKELSNFALNTLPYGGIYLVGGLTSAVGNYMINDPTSPFKDGFFSKGKIVNSVLEKFPIYIVKAHEQGLQGAFVKAQKDGFKL